MKYGRIAVGKDLAATRCARVFVDGIEVTRDCFEADDVRGYARVFKKTTSGARVWERKKNALAVETLVGQVEILLRPRESARRIRSAARAEVCSSLPNV